MSILLQLERDLLDAARWLEAAGVDSPVSEMLGTRRIEEGVLAAHRSGEAAQISDGPRDVTEEGITGHNAPLEQPSGIPTTEIGDASPGLSAPDVSDLWTRYKASGDGRAKDRLVLAYAPLVEYVAGRMRSAVPVHVEQAELISYGMTGLISAIERFELSREIKFEAYAITRIRGAISDELRMRDRVPESVHRRAREIERANAKLEARLHRAPRDEELAAELGLSVTEFDETLAQITDSRIVALDLLWIMSNLGGDVVSLLDTLPDTHGPGAQDPDDDREMRRRIADAIAALPDRERLVIALCYHENLTFREIGEVLNVTEARVSQLHTKSLLRLRSRLQDELGEWAEDSERDSGSSESARGHQSFQGTADGFCHVLLGEPPYHHTLCGQPCPLPVNGTHQIGECPSGFPVCPTCTRIGGGDPD